MSLPVDLTVAEDASSGRAFVLAKGFAAVREAGAWRPGVVAAADAEDNFSLISDSTRTALLFREAWAALSSKANRK